MTNLATLLIKEYIGICSYISCEDQEKNSNILNWSPELLLG